MTLSARSSHFKVLLPLNLRIRTKKGVERVKGFCSAGDGMFPNRVIISLNLQYKIFRERATRRYGRPK